MEMLKGEPAAREGIKQVIVGSPKELCVWANSVSIKSAHSKEIHTQKLELRTRTDIVDDMAADLELLQGDGKIPREDEDIPVFIAHVAPVNKCNDR